MQVIVLFVLIVFTLGGLVACGGGGGGASPVPQVVATPVTPTPVVPVTVLLMLHRQ
jgi:hypothetical protein